MLHNICVYIAVAWVVPVMDHPSQRVVKPSLKYVIYTAMKAGSEVAYIANFVHLDLGYRVQNVIYMHTVHNVYHSV